MDELVSIVIPTYNRKEIISRAIDSCIRQTYANIEIIICDDHSTDDTLAFLKKKYSEELRIKYCSTPENHKGSNAARNQGLRIANGRYITFLDSDDYLLEDSIENRIACFDQIDDIDMVYGDLYLENGEHRKKWIYTNLNEVLEQKKYILRELALCPTMTIMIKKDIFENIGLLDELLPAWQDDALVLSIIMNGYRVYHCNRFIGVVIKSDISITSNKYKIYTGLKKLLETYKDEIKDMSVIRYVIWRVRLVGLWCYAKEMEKKGLEHYLFWFLHNLFRCLTRPFFVDYFE